MSTVGRRGGRGLRTAGFHLLVWGAVAVVSFPLVWMVVTTLHPTTVHALVSRGVTGWLRGASLDGYRAVLFHTSFPRYLFNSAFVATASAAASALLGTFAAYALARLDFPGRRAVGAGALLLTMVPQVIIVIPLFIAFRRLGLYNTYWGLTLAYVAFTLPFTTWVLRGFFHYQPDSLEEAAMTDGCSRPEAVVRVFLPVAAPAIGAGFVFAWILAYNDYLFALVLINDPSMRTITVGIGYASGGNPLTSAVLATLPMLVLSTVLARFFRVNPLSGLGGH